MKASLSYDAVIIGGGFYGVAIAIHLAKHYHMQQILLVEQEAELLSRASFHNQARIHNGYHYPRSFTTAYRSRQNFSKFIRDWPQAVKKDFIKLYAIGRRNSKVTAKQFERFCGLIGAPLQTPAPELKQLFNSHLIENTYQVQEYAFDRDQLAKWAQTELAQAGITVHLQTSAKAVYTDNGNKLQIVLQGAVNQEIYSPYVFNCTYSGLNQIAGDVPKMQTELKQEITEMALIRVPSILEHVSVTVMDGPFFSVMPFPTSGLHTLSHVRYTPHLHWEDSSQINPYEKFRQYDQQTRVNRMARDASRFLPALSDAQYVDSLFEIKTILVKNEADDGRPILFEKYSALPGFFSILGSKIDNIYDAIEKIDAELNKNE